jgi:predicted amidophosphoribosyltransferase
VRADLLLRIRHTPPQHGLSRAERLKNVRGAYAVDPLKASLLQGRRVVLVDDVMTTGASLREAAHALRAAGAMHITGMAFARTDE